MAVSNKDGLKLIRSRKNLYQIQELNRIKI